MDTPTLHKPKTWVVQPNLVDLGQTAAAFRWEDARQQLDALPDGGGLNIAHEAVVRHARSDCWTA